MLNIFKPSSEGFLIQTSETDFWKIYASPKDSAELAYKQLWIFSMRHYSEMTKEPESNDVIVKPDSQKPNEPLLHRMAVLARRLGFDSDEIQGLLKLSPDRQIAKFALLQARPPDQYQYSNDVFDSLVDRIVESFEQAAPGDPPPQRLTLSEETKLNARRGFPHRKAQKLDRPVLFIDQLHAQSPSCGKVTTFFVRQCIYFTFLGKSSRGLLLGINKNCDMHQ